MQGIQPRNQLELSQRNQERLIQLGPVLQRQFHDFLDKLVSRTFNDMVRMGKVPPAPKELQDRPLRPRYVSTLALAQEAVATGNMDLFMGSVGSLAQVMPQVLDKIDGDEMVNEYASRYGVPPKIIKSNDRVAKERQAEAQMAQQQAALDQGEQLSNIVEKTGGLDLGADNVASRTLENIGG